MKGKSCASNQRYRRRETKRERERDREGEGKGGVILTARLACDVTLHAICSARYIGQERRRDAKRETERERNKERNKLQHSE